MPRGGYHYPATTDAILERRKEEERRHRERMQGLEVTLQQLRRREKAVGDLKKWLVNRKLELADLVWMVKQLRPKRADQPVKSKKPLQPPARAPRITKASGKRGDPEFQRAVRAARLEKQINTADLGAKIGVSAASIDNWETGRNIPKDEARVKLLKTLGLSTDLGAEATAAMMKSMGGR